MSTFKAIYFILVVEGQLCYNWDSINDDFIIFSPPPITANCQICYIKL